MHVRCAAQLMVAVLFVIMRWCLMYVHSLLLQAQLCTFGLLECGECCTKHF